MLSSSSVDARASISSSTSSAKPLTYDQHDDDYAYMASRLYGSQAGGDTNATLATARGTSGALTAQMENASIGEGQRGRKGYDGGG